MAKFIVTAESKEQFNFKNESLGMSEKLAVFYSPQIGKKRLFRNNLNNPNKGLKLLILNSEKEAKSICDRTNEISDGEFQVEQLKAVTLTEQERVIANVFGSDDKYQLYKCDEHGLQAKLKDTDNGLCSHCRKPLPKKRVSDFLSNSINIL